MSPPIRALLTALVLLPTGWVEAQTQYYYNPRPGVPGLQATPQSQAASDGWQSIYPTPVRLTPETSTGMPEWGTAPVYVAQYYGPPSGAQPAAGAVTCQPCPPVVCVPPAFDPYACSQQPVVGCPTAACPGICTTPVVTGAINPWHNPYFEAEGLVGDVPTTGRGSVFLPVFQQPNSFLFFDIRGYWDDEQAAEGNFGLGVRRYHDAGYFSTFYGFYDFRHTQFNNNFHGVTIGADVFNLRHEARMNWYIPEGGGQPAPAFAQARRSGDAIVVAAGVERAYYGFDAEAGTLLWQGGGLYEAELRGFAGGYYFNNNTKGFPAYGGPRARLEGRLYDLPLLGAGSRLVLEGIVQYDDLRNTQGIAALTLRIPFGAGRSATKLSPIERRMMAPIVRDDDIITNVGNAAPEAARIVETGQMAENITFIDASADDAAGASGDVAAAVAAAGNDSIVVFEGAAGPITIGQAGAGSTVALQPGQFVGGRFAVQGVNSGAVATYGSNTTVQGADGGSDVFTIANNATLTGLNITGGQNGVSGNNATGFTISNNTISGVGQHGISLDGVTHGADIRDNALRDNTAGNGLNIKNGGGNAEFASGSITGNTASGNLDGFALDILSGGDITGNTASENTDDGFDIATVSGGSIADNTASDNGADGFRFTALSGGSISDNTAKDHASGAGFAFSIVNGGHIANNTSANNALGGFALGTLNNNTVVSGNTATGCRSYGYYIASLNNNAVVRDNTAIDNDGYQGFFIYDINDNAVFSGNTAANQTKTPGFLGASGTGFFIHNVQDNAEVSYNSATQNEGNGFLIADQTSGGQFTNNTASLNGENGFLIEAISGGNVSLNTASQNSGDGFNIGTDTEAPNGNSGFTGGNFDNNTSNNNTGSGYVVIGAAPPATATGNTASGNGANNDDYQFP